MRAITSPLIGVTLAALLAIHTGPALAQAPPSGSVVYRGTSGPGAGRHVVLLAGDHEYRSEETLPELARILARRYGFTATVVFTTDPSTGVIVPGSSHVTGLEALDTADLMIVFLRFQDFGDDGMRHVDAYLARGGPVVGLRTATHAFQIERPDSPYRKYTWKGTPSYPGGFGRQILGETWVSHYGRNHEQSSRFVVRPAQANHPILRGVRDVWVQSGGYTADPMPDSVVLAGGQILDGMRRDSPPAEGKKEMPVAWVRQYTGTSGRAGRVFTTTHGASVDLLDDGFRRMVVNACLWAAGLENAITPDNDVSLVGPFRPTTYGFDGFVPGVRPAELAGWESPIPPRARP